MRAKPATQQSMASIAHRLDDWHGRASRTKCPFLRRRATDAVEGAQTVLRWVSARHKSLPLPQGLSTRSATAGKTLGLDMATLATIIETDFNERNAYVTGRLTKNVYADNCFFDGPDPDMPVRGLTKYTVAVGGLFDHVRSRCVLVGAPAVDETARSIVVCWRLSGVLMLPWKPAFKPYLGLTRYTVDQDTGLIIRAEEQWSIPAVVAFLSVVAPDVADRLVGDALDVRTEADWARDWEAAGRKLPAHLQAQGR